MVEVIPFSEKHSFQCKSFLLGETFLFSIYLLSHFITNVIAFRRSLPFQWKLLFCTAISEQNYKMGFSTTLFWQFFCRETVDTFWSETLEGPNSLKQKKITQTFFSTHIKYFLYLHKYNRFFKQNFFSHPPERTDFPSKEKNLLYLPKRSQFFK